MSTQSTSSSSTSIYRIDPLKGAENYSVWKIKMTDILTDLGLIGYVDGSERKPNDDAPDLDKTAWSKKDKQALCTIRLRIADKLLVFAAGAKTSAEAWNAMRDMLEARGPIGIVLARRKFFRAQCVEGTSIEEHIRTLRSYQEELHGLGQKIEDPEFSITLLTSLPESWNSFISAIDSSALEKSAPLIARILEEDRRLQSKPGADTALSAAHRKPKYNPNVTCYNCGKRGHKSPECRSPAKAQGPDRKRFQRGKPSDQAHEAVSDQGLEDFAFMADEGLAASSTTWLADSGCTSHVIRDKSLFSDYVETPGHTIRGMGEIPCLGKGSVKLLSTLADGSTYTITLRDALHAPSSPHNLVSVTRMTDADYTVVADKDTLVIQSPRGTPVAEGVKKGGLYFLSCVGLSGSDTAYAAVQGRTWDEWHRALGHIHMGAVKMLKKKGMVVGMDVDESVEPALHCVPCQKAKHSVEALPKVAQNKTRSNGDLTVTDVWGPARTAAISGDRYFISFTDVKSRHTIIFFMKQKSEALEKFKAYHAYVERQTNFKLKKIRCDNGKEYINNELLTYFERLGIKLETTAPYTPAENGIAECLNRTLVEHARAMLLAHDLPNFLWREALAYANYIKNRSPTRGLDTLITPHEAFWGEKPDISDIQEFGTTCWVLQQGGNPNKLDTKSNEFVFTGLSPNSHAYRYWNPSARLIQTSRNVVFPPLERVERVEDTSEIEISHSMPLEGEMGGTGSGEQPSSGGDGGGKVETVKEVGKSSKPAPRARSARIASQPATDYRKLNNPDARGSRPQGNVAIDPRVDVALVGTTLEDPASLEEAMASPDWLEWEKAMDGEVGQLEDNGTYTKVDLPPGKNVISCKWVFHRKFNETGAVVKHKARLVARGFTQIPGIDYHQTFAPVMRLETLRVLLALATELDLEVHVVDVVGAYLNATLKEEIYMSQIPGYDDGTGKVLRLWRSLYGLKQAGREWNILMDDSFGDLGYRRLFADQCVYLRKRDDDLTIVGVHVDDMGVLASSPEVMAVAKREIATKFEISDLGELKQIVGLEVSRDRAKGTMKLSQSRYIECIVERFGMMNSHAVRMPMDPNVRLLKTPEDVRYDLPLYSSIVGSVMYAALGTRPDIAFAVQNLSQFLSNPSPAHFTAAKRLLRYLNATKDFGITYSRTSSLEVEGYVDADWAGNPDDRRSITGYVFLLANAPVTWSARKQQTVALSSMEAETMGLSHGARELIWLRTLLTELGFPPGGPSILKADNQAAIAFAHDSGQHARSKHISIQHYFVRERIISEEIKVIYCSSKDNLADLLTKALPLPRHQFLIEQVGLTTPELRGSVGNETRRDEVKASSD
ncbi:hypothetical protein ONZ45_g17140 [Pleurotus djamor]|nr:hypothetical protein ONZ45_g17140 [Pleurotus djamor]